MMISSVTLNPVSGVGIPTTIRMLNTAYRVVQNLSKETKEKIDKLHEACPAISGEVETTKKMRCPTCSDILEYDKEEDSYPCKRCGKDWFFLTLSLDLGGDD